MYLGEVDDGGFLDEPQTLHPVLSKRCLVFHLQEMRQAQGKKSPGDKGNCQSRFSGSTAWAGPTWVHRGFGLSQPFYVAHTCAAGHPYQPGGPFVMIC